ncbi:MAG: type II toxin-antitoxin system Phd/YefM family antitoxin [Spirochaetes bacterium]|nr:type II toxin-antitoxin system Phd/YefM family antitoxin [Spirochaetota bacterium]
MSTISVSNLKAHLSREIRQVLKGKTFIVTDHDHPVAVLAPVKTPADLEIISAQASMHTFTRRAQVRIKTDPLEILKEERLR